MYTKWLDDLRAEVRTEAAKSASQRRKEQMAKEFETLKIELEDPARAFIKGKMIPYFKWYALTYLRSKYSRIHCVNSEFVELETRVDPNFVKVIKYYAPEYGISVKGVRSLEFSVKHKFDH